MKHLTIVRCFFIFENSLHRNSVEIFKKILTRARRISKSILSNPKGIYFGRMENIFKTSIGKIAEKTYAGSYENKFLNL